MHLREILSTLTGLSFPIIGGGVSWTPTEAEKTTAKRIITFLEDRRVLYGPEQMEVPRFCVESVLRIREFLTDELGKLDQHSALAEDLAAMRASCRRFLDRVDDPASPPASLMANMGSLSVWIFCSGLGELRGVFGVHIAQIAARNQLDVEDELAGILPPNVAKTDAKAIR